jgi:hypothetical protein
MTDKLVELFEEHGEAAPASALRGAKGKSKRLH